jgi:3-mercaptopyruvate sulfurtransferase SseA
MNAAATLIHPQLVSPRWLAERLNANWLRVLDVRCRALLGQGARDDRSGPRLRDQVSDPPRFVELGPRAGWSRLGRWPKTTDEDYLAGHVPGSTSFDVAHRIFDASGSLVSAPEIAMAMSEAGVGDEHTLVLVDDRRSSAARVLAWALHRYGHANTFILEGGFSRWLAEDRPVTRTTLRHPFASFTARAQ